MAGSKQGRDGSVPALLAAALLHPPHQPFLKGSADDEFNYPPYLLAALKPDSNGTGAYIVHHHRACLIDTVGHLTYPHRADRGVPV